MSPATTTTYRRRGPRSRQQRCMEAQARYGPLTPWWALSTPEERLAAIEAKFNREQPLPTSHKR